jgi:hypothetical protein
MKQSIDRMTSLNLGRSSRKKRRIESCSLNRQERKMKKLGGSKLNWKSYRTVKKKKVNNKKEKEYFYCKEKIIKSRRWKPRLKNLQKIKKRMKKLMKSW